MAELRPIPFAQLLHRVLEEPSRQSRLFDLPLRKSYRPREGLDLSVEVHGHRVQTPVGPAAGPHAQLAQNIVLSWLAGSRIIELKTVQILDELKIPRPCIDAATIGFNVEWSQELKLSESLHEYVAGWMLLRILRHLDPIGLGLAAEEAHPVFELSVGYDLKGLESPAMRRYLEQVQNVEEIIDALRREIPNEQRALRDLDFDPKMVSCVTLSTFHGCPPQEIEAIARYLLTEIGVDVIVKLNPTLLGFEEVSYLLHERMGYHELKPVRSAFEGDLRWEEAIGLGRRLTEEAARVGRSFGVKMTNTLVVENHKQWFDASQKEMYLSGPPLHVLAMHCVERWRAAFGTAVPLSFSGGIDQHNFADAVACDLVPVTTCTDLLRAGGYGRLPRYLENLEEAMLEVGASNRPEFLLHRFGQGAEAVRDVFAEIREEGERLSGLSTASREAADALLGEAEQRLLEAIKDRTQPMHHVIASFMEMRLGNPATPIDTRARVAEILMTVEDRVVRAAGALNAHRVTSQVTGDPRYAAGKNGKAPRKVGSQLALLDCLSCDKCVPVCPNDANFSIDTPPEERSCEDLLLDEAGAVTRAPGRAFVVRKPSQWANYADACNECGNCDIFCPEDGGPYILKARFFGSLASMQASPTLDGIHLGVEGDGLVVTARLAKGAYRLRLPARGPALLDDGCLEGEFDAGSGALLSGRALAGARGPHRLEGAVFATLQVLCRGVLDEKRVNPVSAAVRRSWR